MPPDIRVDTYVDDEAQPAFEAALQDDLEKERSAVYLLTPIGVQRIPIRLDALLAAKSAVRKLTDGDGLDLKAIELLATAMKGSSNREAIANISTVLMAFAMHSRDLERAAEGAP